MEQWNPDGIIPWLMTENEYRSLIDNGKQHPNTAYKTSIGDLYYVTKEKYDIPLRTIKLKGLFFELRMRKEKIRYTKRIDDEIARDDKGMALYYDDSEIKSIGLKPYEYSIGVWVSGENDAIGSVGDEWGCILIRVAKEYENFGLGTILGKIAREIEPSKPSGGFTSGGSRNFIRVHREMVREALINGQYTNAVKSGLISKSKALEIIKDSNLSIRHNNNNDNMNTNDPKDWMLFSPLYNTFILYDKKIKNYLDNENDYFIQKSLKAYIYFEDNDRDDFIRIKKIYGVSPKLKTFMVSLAYTIAKHEKKKLVIEPDDYDIMDHGFILNDENNIPGYKSRIVIDGPIVNNWEKMAREEFLFRKSFDQYDEFKDRLWELL